jgi:outer membrane protein assembly factor BamB
MRITYLVLLSLAVPSFANGTDENWPQWRGPLGTGEAPTANPPLTWSEDENIRWKVALPGRGHATPIIYGDHVFVLAAEGVGEAPEEEPPSEEGGDGGGRSWMKKIDPDQKQAFQVVALNRADGSVAWKSVATEKLPHEGTHGDGTWASASALTDGEHLFAHFGSNGLFAYDLAGDLKWEVQLGKMQTRNGFGEGASPAVYGDTLVVQWDHEGPSFIVGLDKNTGEERWRQDRDEPTSWATPLIVDVGGNRQVVTAGTNHVRSYDLESGEILWQSKGLTTNAIPSPLEVEGVAYLMSGFRGAALVAIQLANATGDLAETDNILWNRDQDTPYVPSALAVDGILYFCKSNSGILSAVDMASGEGLYGPERLETVKNVYASPVGAAGRVYLVGRDGETEVIRHGPEFELLATNLLEEKFDASPALAGGELYLRGASHLYCIAAD